MQTVPFGNLSIHQINMFVYSDGTRLILLSTCGTYTGPSFPPPGAFPEMWFEKKTYLDGSSTLVPDAAQVKAWFGLDPIVLDYSHITYEQHVEQKKAYEKAEEEEYRRLTQEQKRLSRVLVEDYSEEGTTHRDPDTGRRYSQCVSCYRYFGDVEDMHSGGECNLCHAMNKDD